MTETTGTGRCLCGAISYRTSAPLRDVLYCHCTRCLRWNGHVVAATACDLAGLEVEGEAHLRWYEADDRRRGFCERCGSHLFWQGGDRSRISIWAGTLDRPTGLHGMGHIHLDSAGDYYERPDGVG